MVTRYEKEAAKMNGGGKSSFTRPLAIMGACVLVFSHAAVAQTNRATDTDLPFPEPPRLTVPTGASAPMIDGYVNDAEWADAVAFIGLVDISTGLLTDRTFVGFLKSDGQKLYFAFRMKVFNSEVLRATIVTRDEEVYRDDSWELFLYPEVGAGKSFHLAVNPRGTIWDAYNELTAWNGKWEIKQHFHVPEVHAPDLWEAEVAIAWKDLGQAGGVEGSKWGFGFFVNEKTPQVRAVGWTPQTGFFARPDHAAILSFQKEGGSISLASLGKPLQGIVAPVLRFNGTPRNTSLSLTMPSGETIRQSTGTSLEPVAFAPLSGKGRALLQIRAPDNATAAQADYYYGTLLEYDSVPFTVKPVNYPSRNELCLDIDFEAFEKQDEVKQYLFSFGSWSQVCLRTADVPWEKVRIPTSTLNPGEEYMATATLLDVGKKTLATQSFAYTKEGKEPWRDNQVGISPGHVPTPYTPLQIHGATVEMIGRKIDLAANGLPRQILSQGIKLLNEPIRMTGDFAGKRTSLEATTPFKFTTVRPDDSAGSAGVAFGPMTGTLKQTISFDGFCWYELDLAVVGDVTAKDVVLEINLPRAVGRDYQLQRTDLKVAGLDPWESAGVLNTNLSLGFTPQVWLGNDEVGLAWLAESHNGWPVSNDDRVVAITRTKTSVLL